MINNSRKVIVQDLYNTRVYNKMINNLRGTVVGTVVGVEYLGVFECEGTHVCSR